MRGVLVLLSCLALLIGCDEEAVGPVPNPPAVLEVVPMSVTIENLYPERSLSRVRIENPGATPLTLERVVIGGPQAGEFFAVVEDGASLEGLTLAPRSSRLAIIELVPERPGERRAWLRIESQAPYVELELRALPPSRPTMRRLQLRQVAGATQMVSGSGAQAWVRIPAGLAHTPATSPTRRLNQGTNE